MSADSQSALRPNQGLSIAHASRVRNRFWMSIAISILLGGVGGFAVVRYLQSDGWRSPMRFGCEGDRTG
jgi:hypothetical protein